MSFAIVCIILHLQLVPVLDIPKTRTRIGTLRSELLRSMFDLMVKSML